MRASWMGTCGWMLVAMTSLVTNGGLWITAGSTCKGHLKDQRNSSWAFSRFQLEENQRRIDTEDSTATPEQTIITCQELHGHSQRCKWFLVFALSSQQTGQGNAFRPPFSPKPLGRMAKSVTNCCSLKWTLPDFLIPRVFSTAMPQRASGNVSLNQLISMFASLTHSAGSNVLQLTGREHVGIPASLLPAPYAALTPPCSGMGWITLLLSTYLNWEMF